MSIIYGEDQYDYLDRAETTAGGYLNDDSYGMFADGEFTDLQVYGCPYILCKTDYPSCEVGDEHTITEESLYRFDNIDDFLDFTRWQPLAGTIRFHTRRHFPIKRDTINQIELAGNCYGIYYSAANRIIGYEKYKPTGYRSNGSGAGYVCYDRRLINYPEGVTPPPNRPYYIDEYLFSMTLESTSISREFGPKPNGYIYYKVTRKWKTLRFDTDIDGERITPETPPWMYRIDNIKLSSEPQEEAIEKVYPDMSVKGVWQDMLNTMSFFGATQDEILESKKQSAQYKYTTRIQELANLLARNVITKNDHETEKTKAKKTYDAEIKLAVDEYDADKAATESGSSGIVFNEEGKIDAEKMSVAFANSAGVMMEGVTTRNILRIEFSYNAPYFDFYAPVRFKNKVNDRAIRIAGTEYKARSVLMSDLGAEFKREYNEDGSLKWEYWTISVSLCVDDQTYNKDYANIGTHVLEKTEYWVGETEYDTKCQNRNQVYRISTGARAGEIITQERKDALGEGFKETCVPLPIFSRTPDETDFAPRLDSLAIAPTGDKEKDKKNTEDQKFKYPFGNRKMTALEKLVFKDFLQEVNGEYGLVTRFGLAKIYHCDGHYYTKRQLDLQRTDGEHEVVDEPMFLAKDGMSLSPFYENGKQMPVYLRGCIYEPIDFRELGMPEVS